MFPLLRLTHSSFLPVQSMVAFLKDPSGPPLWEENPEAKDVVHLETEKVSHDLNNLLKKILVCSELKASRASVLTYSGYKTAGSS